LHWNGSRYSIFIVFLFNNNLLISKVYSSIQIDDQIQIEMDERTKRLQELNAPNSMQNPYGLAEKYLIDVYSQQNYIDPLEFWKKMREQDHIVSF